tara:strand:- start:487 stop:1494 length:1008 start_codon:yes stop_codon:yes gene_type:complete
MIRAIHFAQLGHEVIVVEKNESLGGAWATQEIGDLRDCEIGPHLIKSVDGIYKILSDLGIPLEQMNPQPKILYFALNFLPILLPIHFRVLFANLSWKNFLTLKIISFACSQLFRRPLRYKYVSGGSGKMLASLERTLESYGGKILCGSRVTDIAPDQHKLSVLLKKNGNSETFESFDKIVMSRSVNLNKTPEFLARLSEESKKQEHHEIILEFKGWPRKYSFIKVHGNKFMCHSVSNQSLLLAKNHSAQNHVIVVRLNSKIEIENQLADLLQELKSLNLIGKKDILKSYRSICHSVKYDRSAPSVSVFNNDQVEVLQTYDFPRSLSELVRWNSIN